MCSLVQKRKLVLKWAMQEVQRAQQRASHQQPSAVTGRAAQNTLHSLCIHAKHTSRRRMPSGAPQMSPISPFATAASAKVRQSSRQVVCCWLRTSRQAACLSIVCAGACVPPQVSALGLGPMLSYACCEKLASPASTLHAETRPRAGWWHTLKEGHDRQQPAFTFSRSVTGCKAKTSLL